MSVIDAIIAKKLCGGGGGGSVPKPLTYDYMPYGYPTKAMGTVTLMEEQEVAFSDGGGVYIVELPNPLSLVLGQTYTVSWDGTEYECVCFNINDILAIGNASIIGVGEDTGEPFLYVNKHANNIIGTIDTSPSHTISVKTTREVVTPMAEKFLPESVATKSDVEVAQTAADAAQSTANAAQTAAKNALPNSGGVIRIDKGGEVATLTLDEFAGAGGTQKRGIQIGGSGAYGHPNILEVTHDDIVIYNKILERRIGGLNGTELFLTAKNSDKTFKITVDDSGTLTATEVI